MLYLSQFAVAFCDAVTLDICLFWFYCDHGYSVQFSLAQSSDLAAVQSSQLLSYVLPIMPRKNSLNNHTNSCCNDTLRVYAIHAITRTINNAINRRTGTSTKRVRTVLRFNMRLGLRGSFRNELNSARLRSCILKLQTTKVFILDANNTQLINAIHNNTHKLTKLSLCFPTIISLYNIL